MSQICVEAEKYDVGELDHDFFNRTFTRIDQSVAMAALFTAYHLRVKAIAALTQSGSTALWMSRHNCGCPIFALTPEVPAQRKMALYRNVRTFYLEQSNDREGVLRAAEDLLLAKGQVQFGAEWPRLLSESLVTTYATLGGFALSIAFGIPIAVWIAYSRTVESYVYPLLVFSQSVPKIAIAPLFVVWFGFGIVPKIIAAFLLGFFPVVVSAVQGVKSGDTDMVDLARAMQGSPVPLFFAVNLPHP